MKEKTLVLICLFFAGFAFAQTPAETQTAPSATPPASDQPLADLLGWMSGNWQGEGLMAGTQEFVSELEVTKELDNQALLFQRESMSKEADLAGGKKEIMVIGYEGATKKILLSVHSSNNSLLIYSGELKGNNEIVFSLVLPATQPGYTYRRVFKLLPNGNLSFSIETATPDKALSKTVEINYVKTS
jgi:hypothetical protein